jgi:hypothetical protein
MQRITGAARFGTGRVVPALLLTVLLAALVVATLAVCGCGEKAAEPATQPLDAAKDVAAKAAVLAIATGVKAQVALTGEAPAEASQATLGAFVSPWPDNPFTGAPMQPGDGPGDYVYRSLGGAGYELAVRLADGSLAAAP